jgi:hypothetical protein
MKRFLLAAAALLAVTASASATIIGDLGVNPTSAGGPFQRSLGALTGAFDDQFTFQLVGGPQFITIASITNVFPGGNTSSDFITNFTGAVFDTVDGIVGNGNDVTVIGPVAATQGCGLIINCQALAGAATLNAGSYYLDVSGIAGGTSGYGGNIATFAVPGPLAGSGLPGLIVACVALWGLQKRRRSRLA